MKTWLWVLFGVCYWRGLLLALVVILIAIYGG